MTESYDVGRTWLARFIVSLKGRQADPQDPESIKSAGNSAWGMATVVITAEERINVIAFLEHLFELEKADERRQITLRQAGQKGGSARSEAKRLSSQANVMKAIAVKRLKRSMKKTTSSKRKS